MSRLSGPAGQAREFAKQPGYQLKGPKGKRRWYKIAEELAQAADLEQRQAAVGRFQASVTAPGSKLGRLFHGGDIEGEIDPYRTRRGRYGRGFYMTTAPDVAGGYANRFGCVNELKAREDALVFLAGRHPTDADPRLVSAVLGRLREQGAGDWADGLADLTGRRWAETSYRAADPMNELRRRDPDDLRRLFAREPQGEDRFDPTPEWALAVEDYLEGVEVAGRPVDLVEYGPTVVVAKTRDAVRLVNPALRVVLTDAQLAEPDTVHADLTNEGYEALERSRLGQASLPAPAAVRDGLTREVRDVDPARSTVEVEPFDWGHRVIYTPAGADGKPLTAGSIDLSVRPADRTLTIESLYLPAGTKRQGLGRRLMGGILRHYQQEGYREADLIATEQGRLAWPRMGFLPENPTSRTVYGERLMERVLPDELELWRDTDRRLAGATRDALVEAHGPHEAGAALRDWLEGDRSRAAAGLADAVAVEAGDEDPLEEGDLVRGGWLGAASERPIGRTVEAGLRARAGRLSEREPDLEREWRLAHENAFVSAQAEHALRFPLDGSVPMPDEADRQAAIARPTEDPTSRTWRDRHYGGWEAGLKEDERNALRVYSAAPSRFLMQAGTLNEALRARAANRPMKPQEHPDDQDAVDEWLRTTFERQVGLMDSALTKAPGAPHDLSLYRGMTLPAGTDYEAMVGRELRDAAYLSTSLDPREAERFVRQARLHQQAGRPVMPAIAEIWLPIGGPGAPPALDTLEAEHLLPRDLPLTVRRTRRRDDGTVVLGMELRR